MRRRRLTSMALGIALALVLLEVALQVGAYALWSRRPSDAAAGQSVVLCVGDSFTYGLGATGDGGSYPRQLETLLRARGDPGTVVNGGWPGQSSREVLLRLPEQLARHRPGRVCVLVGINDPWSRPARVEDGELAAPPPAGFEWRLRLPQVLAMMADWMRPDAGVPPFVGTWHRGDLEVTFEPGGRVTMGKDEVRWMEDEGSVVLVMPQGVLPMRWSITDGRLSVRTASFAHELDPGPAPAPSARIRGEKALANGQVALAKDLLQQALATPSDAAAAREGLARIAVHEGDKVARDRWLDELRADFARTGDADTGAALAHALAASDHVGEGLDVADRVLERSPGCQRAWEVLLTRGLASGAPARVLASMARVLAAARGDEAWRPALLQMRANLQRDTDPSAALQDLVAAFLQDGDRAFLQRQLELGGATFTAPVVDAVLARLPAADATRVRTALAADPGDAGVMLTLRQHLERIVALCRQHGAQVWLLSYPEPEPRRDALTAGVAAAAGAPFVPLHPVFTKLLASTPRHLLFIADGHCTDRGYGEMAAAVASALH